jgi:hypothetical protein
MLSLLACYNLSSGLFKIYAFSLFVVKLCVPLIRVLLACVFNHKVTVGFFCLMSRLTLPMNLLLISVYIAIFLLMKRWSAPPPPKSLINTIQQRLRKSHPHVPQFLSKTPLQLNLFRQCMIRIAAFLQPFFDFLYKITLLVVDFIYKINPPPFACKLFAHFLDFLDIIFLSSSYFILSRPRIIELLWTVFARKVIVALYPRLCSACSCLKGRSGGVSPHAARANTGCAQAAATLRTDTDSSAATPVTCCASPLLLL